MNHPLSSLLKSSVSAVLPVFLFPVKKVFQTFPKKKLILPKTLLYFIKWDCGSILIESDHTVIKCLSEL